jgi:hypothetical protein
LVVELSWLAITRAEHYQSDDRKADTNELLLCKQYQLRNSHHVAIHAGDEESGKRVAIPTLKDLELFRSEPETNELLLCKQ